MAKLRILAVEDEPLHQAKVLMCSEKLGYELIGIEDNYADALSKLIATQPDVILLDIQISGDKDGIELAKRINQLRPTPIIFTSSMTDTATLQRASATQPYGYLVKPIQMESLQAAIEVAIYKFAQEQEDKDKISTNNNNSNWQQDTIISNNLFIKDGKKLVKVPVLDILWIEVDKDKYCKVVTDQKVFFVRNSLGRIAEKLPSSHFVQTHRSLIVQTNAIDSINDTELTVEIQGTALPIGKTYKKELMKKVNTL